MCQSAEHPSSHVYLEHGECLQNPPVFLLLYRKASKRNLQELVGRGTGWAIISVCADGVGGGGGAFGGDSLSVSTSKQKVRKYIKEPVEVTSLLCHMTSEKCQTHRLCDG